MNENELIQWAKIYNIKEYVVSYFWRYIKNYLNGENDYKSKIMSLIDLNYLTLEDWSISYSIIFLNDPDNLRHNYSYTINLNYHKEFIGVFKVFFTEKGELIDEEFEIEHDPWVKKFCLAKKNKTE